MFFTGLFLEMRITHYSLENNQKMEEHSSSSNKSFDNKS